MAVPDTASHPASGRSSFQRAARISPTRSRAASRGLFGCQTTVVTVAANTGDVFSPHSYGKGMEEAVISAEIETKPGQHRKAAAALDKLGFKILYLGPTLSVEGSRLLFESTFQVSIEEMKRPSRPPRSGDLRPESAVSGITLRVPEKLAAYIEAVHIQEPPEFF